jgi:hypothetical protein
MPQWEMKMSFGRRKLLLLRHYTSSLLIGAKLGDKREGGRTLPVWVWLVYSSRVSGKKSKLTWGWQIDCCLPNANGVIAQGRWNSTPPKRAHQFSHWTFASGQRHQSFRKLFSLSLFAMIVLLYTLDIYIIRRRRRLIRLASVPYCTHTQGQSLSRNTFFSN